MDENQNPCVAILPNGHPSFFRFAVLLVKDGDGQWIQKDLGGTLETDPVLTQIRPRLDGVPLESVAQLSPTVWVCYRPNLIRPTRSAGSFPKAFPHGACTTELR